MRWRIGCDPELFLKDATTGKFTPAIGIVPGTKQEPHKVKKGTVQVDGLAAEIGIDPATSAEEFADNVQTVLEELRVYTGELQLEFIPYTVFGEKVYAELAPEHKVLGCDPDFNAYTSLANNLQAPNPPSARGAGGHIHIGWTDNEDLTDVGHYQDCISAAIQMDWFLGMPMLEIEERKLDMARRIYYGRAGSFRAKPYGVEYRTPSNAWLKDRSYMLQVFKSAVAGMDRLYSGEHLNDRWPGGIARSFIEDHKTAPQYVSAGHIPHFSSISQLLTKKTTTTSAVSTASSGMIIHG